MTALPRVDTIPASWWLRPVVMRAERSGAAPELPNFASLLSLPAELGAARLPLRDALQLRESESKSYLLLPIPLNTTLRAPGFAGPLVAREPPPSPWRSCHACLSALNATAIQEHVAHWRLLALGGGAGSGVDGHSDALALGSWSRQLTGRKRWRLCGDGSCSEVTLQPGETLVYPPRWWHGTSTVDRRALRLRQPDRAARPRLLLATAATDLRRNAHAHLSGEAPRVPCARACRRPRSRSGTLATRRASPISRAVLRRRRRRGQRGAAGAPGGGGGPWLVCSLRSVEGEGRPTRCSRRADGPRTTSRGRCRRSPSASAAGRTRAPRSRRGPSAFPRSRGRGRVGTRCEVNRGAQKIK